MAVLRDLSRIRQLEAEVRRGETLAAAGRMAVGLAHEIRNPLGAIRGAVQLLGASWAEPTLARVHRVLLNEVDRVNRIIEMLLDLGRPATIHPVPLNLHQLLERIALLSEETARERRVTIVRRYDPSLPPILGDEDRLMQVFHNLVRNAIEAMADGGQLTLGPASASTSSSARWISAPASARWWRSQVMDEGRASRRRRARGSSTRSSPPRRGARAGAGHLPPGARATPRRHPGETAPGRAPPSPVSCPSRDERQEPAWHILIADDEDSLRWVLEKGLRRPATR